MQKQFVTAEKICPATGQACIRDISVFDRHVTLRRWTGGNVKATTCSLECSEKWAEHRGYIATGVSETHADGKSDTVVIVQHPDQVHSSIKIKQKQGPPR